MIRTVADLLSELLRNALPLLDASEISHAPTIGDMYEGLSRDILERAIPEGLGLKVVEGFATDGNGNISGQLDCMLVHGEGSQLPFTNTFVWHVKDIIAVIEVKKTLRSSEMADALRQLQSVFALEEQYRERAAAESADISVDIRPALQAFATTTRQVADHDNIEELPIEDQMIFHALIVEHVSVVRIVIGHHGFKSETAFRRALLRLIESNLGEEGFSPTSLPQLIISGNYSLVKANGRPYVARKISGEWPFYLSSPLNPLLLLMELIWTRLAELFDVTNLWGEDLELEVLHPLLLARGELRGWHYTIVDPSGKQLKAAASMESWSPAYLTLEEFVVLQQLCRGKEVRLDDENLLAWLSGREVSVNSLRDKLLDTALVAIQGLQLQLIAHDCLCAILPSGEYVAAENNSGRMTRWLMKRMAEARQDES